VSGRPALITRYTVTLTAAHFPVGDEEYEFGIELEDGEEIIGSGVVSTLDGDPPTITGAGDPDGAATTGSATVYVVVAEPGLAVTVAPPEEPE
jgi:hypothetical protein